MFSLPIVQSKVADFIEETLSEEFQTMVEVGSVNLGLFNRVTIDDFIVYEPNGDEIVRISRVSASIDVFSLLYNKVNIGTAQLFGTKVKLYKENLDSPLNCQFIIDALSSDDDEPSKLNISIGTFIIRNASISYDVLSMPSTKGILNTHHFQLDNLGANICLNELTNESVDLTVHRLQMKEKYSCLQIQEANISVKTDSKSADVEELSLKLPHSYLTISPFSVDLKSYDQDKSFSFTPTLLSSNIKLSDLSFLSPELASIDDLIECTFSVEGNNKKIAIENFFVATNDNSLVFKMNASLYNLLDEYTRKAKIDVDEFYVSSDEIQDIVSASTNDESLMKIIESVGSILYSGSILYFPNKTISSEGKVHTEVGEINYDLAYDSSKTIDGTVNLEEIDLGKLLSNDELGLASATLDCNVNLSQNNSIPSGEVLANIKHVVLRNHDYIDTAIEILSSNSNLEGKVKMNDNDCLLTATGAFSKTNSLSHINLDLNAEHVNLTALNLLTKNGTEKTNSRDVVSGNIVANLVGNSLNSLLGNIKAENLVWLSDENTLEVPCISINGEPTGEAEKLYTIESGIVDGKIEGNMSFSDLPNSVLCQIEKHLSLLNTNTTPSNADYSYDFTVTDSPILHKFIDDEFEFSEPISVSGFVKSGVDEMMLLVDVPHLTYNGTIYENLNASCQSNEYGIDLNIIAKSLVLPKVFNDVETVSNYSISAHAANNKIQSNLHIDQKGRNAMLLNMHPTIVFSDSIGKVLTNIVLSDSHAVINDTAWIIPQSQITIYNDEVVCNNVTAYSKASNSSIVINGKASKNKKENLVVHLTEIPVNYVTSAINFHSVEFGGRASGNVITNNLLAGGVPDFNAELNVSDFTLQGGSLGDANIHAHWDKEIGGVVVDAHFVDMFDIPDGISNRKKTVSGITTLEGYIAPSTRGILLNVNTMNTNAKFLEGWIGSVFSDVSGTVSGPLTVLKTADQFDLLGDIVPNINLTLRPTNMTYHLEKDTLRFQPNVFHFEDITLQDKYGHTSMFNVDILHRKLGKFGYDVSSNLDGLCVYDEKEFNSDKFYATLFAKGRFKLRGRADEPLTIDANIVPTKGSLFAYDASTPDAIIGNSFIEFRDRDSVALAIENQNNMFFSSSENDSLKMVYDANNNYHGDIRLNFNIALNPDCEVKLKMDNIEDGYMSTRGYANLNATWYNKGTFQLFGDYNIESGSYRMYLHDLIFRDLILQRGSKVSFNGNPFDANIRLLCHHTLNSVPLNDLTSTSSVMKNNKVKVVCVVDIMGKLDNMDFKFDMEMPNVSDEVRQLVRSLVSTEEEMNTQMLYLLGVGRFFPNQYARANGNDNSGQAMNSLLSSTLSGQINQMLSSVMGKESNWTLGSSLVTGERGWEDLDVEGTLSGKMFDDRLLLNGNFGYRDNSMTNKSSFIGDFELKWRTSKTGNLFIKAYNQTNDRYFTKATLNTQGIGLSWQHDFETIRKRMKK